MKPSPAWRLTRVALFVLFGAFFLVPLVAMFAYSIRRLGGGLTGQSWANLVQDPALSAAIVTSLLLAVFTVALMLLLLLPLAIAGWSAAPPDDPPPVFHAPPLRPPIPFAA